MAVDNEIVLIGIALAFNYLVIMKRMKYLGGIVFLGLGLAIMSFNTGNLYAITGLLTMIGGLATIVYDVLTRK